MSRYVFGKHPVRQHLDVKASKPLRLYVIKGAKDLGAIEDEARKQKLPIEGRDKNWFEHLAKDARHQGVALELPDFDYATLESVLAKLPPDALFVALDQVEDPHNLGALIRSAEAAGARAIILPQDRAAQVTPIVEKAAAGATAFLPIVIVVNLSRALEQLKKANVWVYGLAGESKKSLYDLDFKGRCCLVLGGEAKGLRPLVRQHCDELVRIPMAGKTESLNVSVAGGVALFEVVRQRTNRKN